MMHLLKIGIEPARPAAAHWKVTVEVRRTGTGKNVAPCRRAAEAAIHYEKLLERERDAVTARLAASRRRSDGPGPGPVTAG
jgi:hypothetical protein